MALTKVQNTGIADDAVTTDKIENTTVVAADIAAGTVSADKLASTLDLSSKTVTLKNNEISNAELANSSVTINGSAISLGGSGTVKHIDWQSVVVADGSTTLSAVAGRGYFLDTNAGVIEVFLPSSPSRGDTIVLADYAGHFDLNQIIINTGGKNIDSTATGDVKVTTKNAIVELVYVDANKGWLVKMNQTAGTTPGTVMQTLSGSGIYDSDASFIEATGGTVTTTGNFKIHKFTGDGNFVVTNAGNAQGNNKVDYLVVAGGGGGGRNSGGGGGAGGYRTTFPSPGCNAGAFPISATTYPISVGAGGAAGNPNCDGEGCSGSQAIFATITSTGGGGGGSPTTPPGVGLNGGSGGGGGPKGFPFGSCGHLGGSGNTPPVSPPQGNNGGRGAAGPNCGGATGGGGGASATGTNAVVPGSAPSTNMGGCGGAGSPNSITGTAVTYAGGGGGSKFYTPGAGIPVPSGAPGGVGGGGTGGANGASPSGPSTGTAATANTGGGGGGGGDNGAAGNGGKGIVIIRYKFQ